MAEPIKNALKFAAAVFVIATGLGLLGIGAFATATGVAWTAVINTAAYAFVGTAAAGIIGNMNSKGIEASADNLGAKTTVRNPLKFRQIIYGKTKVAGAVTHMETSGNDNHRLKFVVVFSGHPVTSIESVFFNDTKLTTTTSTINGETVYTVTNSKYVNTDNEQSFGSGRLARFTQELGDQTTVNGYANAQMASITNNSKFKDCCYIMFDLVYDAEKFGGGIPNVTAIIKGKKVYDPRESGHDETDSSTWEWSDNPALIWRDYLADTVYGLKATSDELNDATSNGGVQAAANRCDESVTLADGSTTQNRYTANGFFNMGSDGQGVLSAILSSCAGKMSYTNGKFNIFAGGTQTPSLTITDADIINPVSVVTNPKNADLYNTVKAIYTDSTGDKYQGTDSAIYQDSTYLTNDTPSGETSANFVKMQEIQLPLTVSDSRAQRIARISLNHQRQTTIVQLVTTLSYMRLQPNDWVYLTNARLGFSSKVFEVVGQQLELIKQGDVAVLGTALTLKEIENSVFSFGVNDYVANISDGTDQGGGDLSLGVPTGLSASTQQAVDGATSKYDILVSWTNRASSRVIGTEVAYKLSVASEYSSIQVGKGISQATIPNVVKGLQYNLKARHFDQSAIYSSYTAVVNHTISDTTSVNAPTNFTVTSNPISILLSWTNPNNANLRAIKVYRHTATWTPTDDTYLISSISGEPNKNMVMRFGAGDGLTAGTTYYFTIRAILHTDVHSDFTSVGSGSFTLDNTTVGLDNVEDKSSADIRDEIDIDDLVGSGKSFSVKPNKTNFADGSTEGAFTFQLDDGSSTGVNVFSSAERTKLDRLRLGQDPADATRSIQNNDISINPSGQLAGIGTGNNSIVNNANIVASDIEGTGKAFPENSVTKLGGIEANATVGATAGTDLKDSSDNTLSDEDVRNDDLSLAYSGTNIQIKKGTTQIGSNVDAPNALKNAQIQDSDIIGAGKVFGANQKPNKTTFADNSTEGVFTLGTDGTDTTVNVFSSAERTKLDRLRSGQNPANANQSIVNNDVKLSLNTGQFAGRLSIDTEGTVSGSTTFVDITKGNLQLDYTDGADVTADNTANDTANVNSQSASNVTGAITGAQSNIAGVIADLQTGDQSINGDCINTGTLSANLLDVENLKLQTAGTGSSGTTIVSGSTMDNDLVASIGTGAGYYMGSISYDLISGSQVLGASIHMDIYAGASLVYTKYFPIGIKEGNQYYDAGDAFGHSGDLQVMHMEFGFFYTGTATLNVYLGADSNGTSSSATVKMRAVKFGAEVPSFDTSSFTASRTGVTAGANSDSGEVDVSGFTGSKSVTLSGHSSARVSVDNGTFQAAGSEDDIDSGMPFEIRLTASSTAGVTRTATVTIEGVSVTYSVTTAGTYSPSFGGGGSGGGGFESEVQLR